jgi:hypothetical protein
MNGQVQKSRFKIRIVEVRSIVAGLLNTQVSVEILELVKSQTASDQVLTFGAGPPRGVEPSLFISN